jgi:hypothetical protein
MSLLSPKECWQIIRMEFTESGIGTRKRRICPPMVILMHAEGAPSFGCNGGAAVAVPVHSLHSQSPALGRLRRAPVVVGGGSSSSLSMVDAGADQRLAVGNQEQQRTATGLRQNTKEPKCVQPLGTLRSFF